MTIERRSRSVPFSQLAQQSLVGGGLSVEEALQVLQAPETRRMELVAAASEVRRHHFANTVKVNYLVNLKSGLCPEDCSYCSQRLGSQAEILKYSWLSTEEAASQARAGLAAGASRVCLVASGRGPSNRDIARVIDMVGAVHETAPGAEVCACLGILKDRQAERLAEAGVDAYNHNINTAESHHENIVSTHSYADRVSTVDKAKSAGLSPCSGLIVGMKETDEQIVEALFALREMEADSIPINFLMPFEGTPLAGTWDLTPHRALTIVCLARLVCPDKEVRIAGGRELHLRSLQPMALEAANSLFLGDYLTSNGQAAAEDLRMLADHGFVIMKPDGSTQDPAHLLEEIEAATPPPSLQHTSSCGTCPIAGAAGGAGCNGCSTATTEERHAVPPLEIRRRGAGTELAPNA
ncbi:biotin synthase BioB [Nesterenkonia lacusekhoensis]|uniref:Biotin synthase n=1 Tax=Nesterenkonia lacusekhoensis TaxID=150832 RepID=A0ABS4T3R4_9MICC|nr:biotin synthase BioB [Nesterenkonia lacusekhoensis]MBP2319102.1 biotin synthase [Nesterenkonia lacusekhoensis]